MPENLVQLIGQWSESGTTGLVVLALAFAVGMLTFVPRPPLCLLGGFIFGFAAIPAAIVGTTGGAVLCYLLARLLLRPHYERLLRPRPRLRAVARAVDMEGWKVVGLMRLTAPVPGSVTSYLLGMTGIRVIPYALATAAGIAPQIVAFVYLGVVSQTALDLDQAQTRNGGLLIAGLVLLVVGSWYLTRRVRANMAEVIAGFEAAEAAGEDAVGPSLVTADKA